jgi:glutaryl-CoA dehydrogenase
MIRDAARDYAQGQLKPRVTEAFRHEHTDPGIFKEMGGVGLLGATISEEFGGGGLNYVSYGLIAREVERIDSGYRSMMSVQSSLVMLPIFQFGARRSDRLLRSDRTRPWLGPGQHDHPRPQRRRRLSLVGSQDLDHQQPDCERVRGLGKDRR